MAPPVLVAGLDERGLSLEAPVLRREGHPIETRDNGRELLEAIARMRPPLVVLGPRLPDLTLPAAVHRIRASPVTRRVSILVLMTASEPVDLDVKTLAAGANAVLRRPLDQALLDSWIAKLLAVPRRLETRVPVEAQVVGTPRDPSAGHFFGLTRNVSIAGMLLASPIRLDEGPDLDLEFELPGLPRRMRALGRVVRPAPEVGWPYLGYGVEFLFLPPETLEAITQAVHQTLEEELPGPEGGVRIHSTLRREMWVYEIHEPAQRGGGWHAEIRRSPIEGWRPGMAGPFYVVDGVSRDDALDGARAFIRRLS